MEYIDEIIIENIKKQFKNIKTDYEINQNKINQINESIREEIKTLENRILYTNYDILSKIDLDECFINNNYGAITNYINELNEINEKNINNAADSYAECAKEEFARDWYGSDWQSYLYSTYNNLFEKKLDELYYEHYTKNTLEEINSLIIQRNNIENINNHLNVNNEINISETEITNLLDNIKIDLKIDRNTNLHITELLEKLVKDYINENEEYKNDLSKTKTLIEIKLDSKKINQEKLIQIKELKDTNDSEVIEEYTETYLSKHEDKLTDEFYSFLIDINYNKSFKNENELEKFKLLKKISEYKSYTQDIEKALKEQKRINEKQQEYINKQDKQIKENKDAILKQNNVIVNLECEKREAAKEKNKNDKNLENEKNKNEQLNKENESINKKNQDLLNENKELNNQIKDLTNKNDNLENDSKMNIKRITYLSEENENLKKEIEKLKKENKEKDMQIKTLKNQNSKYLETINSLKNTIQNMCNETEYVFNKIKENIKNIVNKMNETTKLAKIKEEKGFFKRLKEVFVKDKDKLSTTLEKNISEFKIMYKINDEILNKNISNAKNQIKETMYSTNCETFYENNIENENTKGRRI